jgi:hypothetical protein
MILDVARDFAFREACVDRGAPCLLKLKACLFKSDASTVEKSTSTGVVEFV